MGVNSHAQMRREELRNTNDSKKQQKKRDESKNRFGVFDISLQSW